MEYQEVGEEGEGRGVKLESRKLRFFYDPNQVIQKVIERVTDASEKLNIWA